MSRANSRDTAIRHALEAVNVELAVVKIGMPLMRLRIEQARDRTGLNDLLSPALDELVEMVKAVNEAQLQVTSALVEVGGARAHS